MQKNDDKKDTTGIRVFVYGSLKDGHGNAGALSGADLLGRCLLRGKYRMLDLRYYPGLVMTNTEEPDVSVLGEVYRVSKDTLDTLDLIEGHPTYYCRHKVTTPWKGAWAYFLPQAYLGQRPEVDPTNDVQIWRPTDEELEYVRSQHAGI